MGLTGFKVSDTVFSRRGWFSSDGFSTQERDNMETQSKVNFNVEFFHGENETLLLNTTLNDIQLFEVDRFRKILNDYLDSACFNSPDTFE